MEQVALGLGCNIGDRLVSLQTAVDLLGKGNEAPLQEIRCSTVYESPAMLPEGASEDWNMPFLNMAVVGKTRLPPLELLHQVKQLEQELGRQRRGHWGPREMDIDILLYGQQAMDAPELTIPHPGLFLRDFVIVPLAEVWPGWMPAGGQYKGISAQELSGRLFAKHTLSEYGTLEEIPCTHG